MIKDIKRMVINLGPLKKGGGQNVALNFLSQIFSSKIQGIEFFFIAADGSDIVDYLRKANVSNVYVVSSNPIVRIFQEFLLIRNWLDVIAPDLIYTYFGFGLFPKKYLQVSGSADSNLYFPDVDFWCGENFFDTVKRKIVDAYRIFGLRRCTAVIYENKSMYDRSNIILKSNQLREYICPSIDLAFDFLTVKDKKFSFDCNKIKLLFLCSWQRNKNILLIPEMVKEFSSRGVDVEVVLTAVYDSSPCAKEFEKLIKLYGVSSRVRLIGSVKKGELRELYGCIDYVMLLSKLESFSNNIIEAWAYGKPLVVASEEWSHAICGNAAIYVDRENVSEIVNEMLIYINNESAVDALLDRASKKLNEFPSIKQRVEQEINFLRKVCESH